MYELQTKKSKKNHSKITLPKQIPNATIQRITFSQTAYDVNNQATPFSQNAQTMITREYGNATQKLTDLTNDPTYAPYRFLNDMLTIAFDNSTTIYPSVNSVKAASIPLGPNEISLDESQHNGADDYRISLYHEGFHIACHGLVGQNEIYYTNPTERQSRSINTHVNRNNQRVNMQTSNRTTVFAYPYLNPDSVAFWINSQP